MHEQSKIPTVRNLMVNITVWFVMAITSADAFLTYRNLNRI